MEWKGNHIETIPPKRPKKLTGTRFASIMGLNPWSTPFEIWCAVTRTYEEPFDDTKYTLAGKAIEPKQAEYMKQAYFMSNLVTPTDAFGENYFKKTYGDFFHEYETFGGMWDYLLCGKDGKPTTVLEMKTTKRVEDWADDIPEYYALQAALYAYLLGVDDVIMVASFLEDDDYDHPDMFQCSSDNTIIRPFKLSERYPNFEQYIQVAQEWWDRHVRTGISPDFDERKDADILKVLRTNTLSPETDVMAMVKEAEDLKAKIDRVKASISEDENRYKSLVDMIKKSAMQQFRDGDKKVSITGGAYTWEVSRSTTSKIDKKAMEADGVLEKYTTSEESYRITMKENKE